MEKWYNKLSKKLRRLIRRTVRRKTVKKLSLFFFLSAVLLLVPALLLSVSAEPGEIEDLSYQTLSGADVTDGDTDLRFVFTVGSLGYSEVGVICSKTVETPVYDADNCHTYKTTLVHSSITADGKTLNAPAGRYYVAVKLTGIPHSYFDGPLYLRAFVRDGGGVRYSEVKSLTVCRALGHEHELPWNALGTATMLTEGTLSGHCEGCNLDVTKTGVKREPIVYNSASPSGPFANGLEYRISKNLSDVRGEDHFYPTDENQDGKDLFIEFSFLYNETQANLGSESQVLTVMYVENYNLFNINLKTGKITARMRTSQDSPQGNDAYIYPTPAAIAADPSLKEVAIGEYGWHRFGVRIHEEAVIEYGEVVYTITASAYLDGVKIFEIDKTVWENNAYNHASVTGKLYLATIDPWDDTELIYSDPSSLRVSDVYVMDQLFYDENRNKEIYLVLGDVYVTCGTDFVQKVERVDDPAAAAITLGENDYPAAMYYRLTD